MTQMPDDEPALIPSPAVIPQDTDFLPPLPGYPPLSVYPHCARSHEGVHFEKGKIPTLRFAFNQ